AAPAPGSGDRSPRWQTRPDGGHDPAAGADPAPAATPPAPVPTSCPGFSNAVTWRAERGRGCPFGPASPSALASGARRERLSVPGDDERAWRPATGGPETGRRTRPWTPSLDADC